MSYLHASGITIVDALPLVPALRHRAAMVGFVHQIGRFHRQIFRWSKLHVNCVAASLGGGNG